MGYDPTTRKEVPPLQQNLTTGSVWKTVVRFSLPYLLSYLSLIHI